MERKPQHYHAMLTFVTCFCTIKTLCPLHLTDPLNRQQITEVKPVLYGHATVQVISGRTLPAECRVQSQASRCRIRGGKHCSEKGFLRVVRFSLSVLFHHCCTSIYLFITDSMQY